MKFWIYFLLLTCAPARAAESCAPVRLGYSDRERVPYFMGDGDRVPASPGVLVELFAAALRSVDCPVTLVRLPTLRVRLALASGAVDLAPADLPDEHQGAYALPLTAGGGVDERRALHTRSIVFVRSADRLPAGSDPHQYFKTHTLAVNQGTTLAAYAKGAGLRVDDGAADSWRNFDKVGMLRADGFTVSLLDDGALDPYIAVRYGDQFVRLAKPVRVAHIWLAANRDFYQRHRARMEAVWSWIGANGAAQVSELTRKYQRAP